MLPDNLANRSISNFWFLDVTKHCTQAANNGTSFFDQVPSAASNSSIPKPIPHLNPPTPACLNEGRRNNVMLGFLWGSLFTGLLVIFGLGILKHLRKARTIRQTRHNGAAKQEEMAEAGLGTRGCVASPVVVVGGAVNRTGDGEESRVRFARGF